LIEVKHIVSLCLKWLALILT